jgi:uncharacterized protein (DUF1810 family)
MRAVAEDKPASTGAPGSCYLAPGIDERMDDRFDLERFVSAQDAGGTYQQAVAELRAGRKRSHWMWFVFPQIAGLGRSDNARRYAISGLEEAGAYLAHPVLGPRLRECTQALLDLPEEYAQAVGVFGQVDAAKLRSSMTLFARADDAAVFPAVLERYFGGVEDDATTRRL